MIEAAISKQAQGITDEYLAMLSRGSLPKWFPKEPGNHLGYAQTFTARVQKRIQSQEAAWSEDKIFVQESLWRGFSIHWYQSGMPVFKISDALAASMVLTDFDEISFSEAKLPFQSFMIEIDGVSPLVYGGERLDRIAVMSAKMPFENIDATTRFSFESARIFNVIYLRGTTNSMEVKSNQLYITPDGESVEAMLMNTVTSKNQALREAMARIAIGISVLLNNDHEAIAGATTEIERKKRRKYKSVSGERTYTEIVVGREIKISDPLDMIAVASNVSSGEVPPDGTNTWKLKNQILVRGHFTKQPYGPRSSLRRRQFIQPYWRGPEVGPRSTRRFTLEEDGEY